MTNENNDMHQLNNVKEKIIDIKNELEVDGRIIVTDSGYYDEREILKANDDECCEI